VQERKEQQRLEETEIFLQLPPEPNDYFDYGYDEYDDDFDFGPELH